MDFSNAIKKPFTDWKKLLIGVALSLLPIIKWFAKGFILESSGLGKHKDHKKMPEWKNFGDYFMKGLAAWVITAVYMIPAMIVLMIGGITLLTGLFNTYIGNIIPKGMVTSVIAGKTSADALVQLLERNWFMAIPTLLTVGPIILLAVVLALVAAYLLPAAILGYVSAGNFGEAFRFGKVFGKAFTGDYFLAWIVVAVITGIATPLLAWIPLLGMAAVYFITGVFGYTLLGEVYKKA